ncbi:MAG TPA: hypothetical protein VN631_04020 [Negativicutes bacterium]|nr:hypothetical protein [Negativicutes bacterium]
MSNKKDILIVGVLSTVLFTGFTAYTHVAGRGRTVASPQSSTVVSPLAPQQSTNKKNVATPSSPVVQNATDSQVAPPADPTPPPNTTRTKNTKTKAS